MKTHLKIVFLGAKSTGKTSIIHQLIYGKTNDVTSDTVEDIYMAMISDFEKGNVKEKVNFVDTQSQIGNAINSELIKLYLSYADAFVLIYSINDYTSYQVMDQIRKIIEKLKDKKEIPMIVLGNKVDKFRERQITPQEWHTWVQKERVQIFEVTSNDRNTLLEPIRQLINKLLQQSNNKSSFPQLHRKTKTGNISIEL